MTLALPGWARIVWLAGALAAAAACGGCANLYLHSDTRQQQSEAATKAWAEVEHVSLFTTERENLAKLAQAEQQTQAHVATAIRSYLAAVITAPAPEKEDAAAKAKRSVGSVVLKRARADFETLVGPMDSYDRRIQAGDELAPFENSIAGLLVRLKAIDVPLAGCADLGTDPELPEKIRAWLGTLSETARIDVNDTLRTLGEDCRQLAAMKTKQLAAGVDAAALGKMKAAVQQRDADARELAQQRATFQVAKAKYDAALAAYATAEAGAAAPAADATVAARVAEAATALRAQIALLRGLNNALAQEFIANETLDGIDGSLAAVIAGKAGDEAKKAVVFAVQAPALIDRFEAAIAQAKKPLVLPLLIRRNAEQLQRDAAAADVKLLQTRVETSQRIVDAVKIQAAALRRSVREFDAAVAIKPGALDQPWAETLDSSSPRTKQLVLSATARYLDAASRLEGERYGLEYARLGLDHQRGLAYAETSVAQWANLIDAGVGQLDAFAKGGIDKAVLSDLAKILGLFWIGHGVNK